MAVKKDTKPADDNPVPQPTAALIVDELGQIQQRKRSLLSEEAQALLKILDKQEADAKARLLAVVKPPANDPTIVEGFEFIAQISPAANERTVVVPNSKLARLIDQQHGRGAYIDNSRMTLTVIEQLLPVEITEKIITSERTGRRVIETASKAALKRTA